MLSQRERLQACLQGDPALDRPPVALWRHFPGDDQHPGTLAAATLAFQRAYDFDLVKVTPASSFCLKDWGAEDAWRGNPEGTRDYTRRVIQTPQDWERLRPQPADAPHLAAQLECLAYLRTRLGPQVPLIQTIFSPLAQAKNLCGGEVLMAHLRLHPEAVCRGLETITRSTRAFIDAASQQGIDGIFYAVQHAQGQLLSVEEFNRFARRQDLELLNAASALWCNIVHLHGTHIHFEAVAAYPAQVLNWHDRETEWSLARGQARFSGSLCGGISRQTMVYADPAAVAAEGRDALQQTGGQRFILGTGCVVPVIAPHGNILAVRQLVERS